MRSRDGSLDAVLRSGLAGGIAGCAAKTAVAPLDRVKILFQTSNPDFKSYSGSWNGVFRAARDIYADGGFRGLLQGHSATLARVFPYAAIKFMVYDEVHHALMPTRESETNFRRFAAGSIAGTISVFFTYPLELIRVRMAFETRNACPNASPTALRPRPSIAHTLSLIYREGPPPTATSTLFTRVPLLKFYRGFTVTIAGIIPYAGTSFLTWGFLRSVFLPHQPSPKDKSSSRRKGTPIADLGLGAVSGALAQTASYPFEVVRRRMQVGGLTSPGRWMRWGETARAIWTAAAANGPPNGWRHYLAGMRGFYVGLTIGYLKVVPMTGISFMVWEAGKRVLNV